MKMLKQMASALLLLLGLTLALMTEAATTITCHHWDALGSPITASNE